MRRRRASSRIARLTVAASITALARTAHALISDVDIDPRYVVHVLRSPMDSSPITKHRVIDMTAANGASYKCVVPDDGDRDDVDASLASSSAAEEEEAGAEDVGGRRGRAASRRHVDELLSPLRGRCFYHANGDWWTYEFCHEKHVEQFHREGTTRMNAYDLGKFDARATAALDDVDDGVQANRKNDAASGATAGDASTFDAFGDMSDGRYHAHAFTHGTTCGDVGAQFDHIERSSEVRFMCSEDGTEGVASVDEPATCTYVLTFRTPLACQAKTLRPKKPDVESIVCSRVDDADAKDIDEPPASDKPPRRTATAAVSRDEL